MLPLSLLLFVGLLAVQPYRAVVLDAATGQPISAATVRHHLEGALIQGAQFEGSEVWTTDARGRFRLEIEGPAVRVSVSCPGYAAATVLRPLRTGAVDTIRLTRSSLSLPLAEYPLFDSLSRKKARFYQRALFC